MREVKTVIPRRRTGTERDLENILLTHTEQAKVVHDAHTTISYQRTNHVPFKYRLEISNPEKRRKKVMVRLWLGLASDLKDVR